MSEVDAVNTHSTLAEDNTQNDKGSKSKKTKSSRLSTIDRAREESEAITKGLTPDVQVEGRRITRSATKGVPATPPPPAKKERKSSTTGKARGRPKKNATNAVHTDESDSHDETMKDASVTENDESLKNNDESKKSQPAENNMHNTKEELDSNNTDTSKTSVTTENGADEDAVDASGSDSAKNNDEEFKSENKTQEDSSPVPETDTKSE